MGTLSDLQQHAVQEELRVQQTNKMKAKTVLHQHAKAHGWSEDEEFLVATMLGLDLPPSMLHSGQPMAFNGGVS
jgi:hypothetical protein